MGSVNGKTNKSHRHPQANHQPRQKAANRKLLAVARQEVYNELSIERKLAMLPEPPVCEKQRKKLMAQLEKRKNGGKETVSNG